ncbi:TPA: amidophosphoribosyltransferase [Candidatus Sumerlaeota bacterium]|nr:amidophosphoribosyltransferase [Candidatus Sumerlaeota bacterium]
MESRIPREECGIVGIYNAPEASKLAYLALYALQHRGQESAGIVSAEDGRLYMHKSKGLVADVFSADTLEALPGARAIGHVRYSTTGSNMEANVQPLLANYHAGSLAVAHNGNLTNADALRAMIEKRGAIFQTTTDSEIFLHLIAHSASSTFKEALLLSLMRTKGAFSLLLLRPDSMVAVRDPNGFRPMVIGKLGDGYVVASETCAFDIMGAEYIREALPGEILTFDKDGMHSEMPFAKSESAYCVFENIYYSRPDSIASNGRSIYEIRADLGRELAREFPVEADVVIGVPDSAIPASIGYAQESGIPYEMGLIRNHYIGRTFIEPQQSIRDFGARIKYNPVRGVLEGKRVVVVDDSIVRGTTIKKMVNMLRRAGAKEVHVRSSAPPWIHPCYYGVDTPSPKELVASYMTPQEICEMVKADSLGYLSIEGMRKVMPAGVGYCQACFDGIYAAGKPANFVKEIMEG